MQWNSISKQQQTAVYYTLFVLLTILGAFLLVVVFHQSDATDASAPPEQFEQGEQPEQPQLSEEDGAELGTVLQELQELGTERAQYTEAGEPVPEDLEAAITEREARLEQLAP